MTDEIEQSDEIMALQSIYGDGTFVCNVSEKPFTGKISIFLKTDAEEHNFTCNGDVIILKHLTPLILNFSLPSNYPSMGPPDVTLSCLWLTPQQLKILSDKLHEKWSESYNSVVLFTWIEFLKTEVFELLDIKFPIDVTVEQILTLTEQSLKREEGIFKCSIHFCPVCFLEKPGTQCVRLSICDHIFCKECLAGFLSLHISEGNVNALRCPSEECDEQVYPDVIKSLVSQSDFERYDRLLLQNTLDVMPDVEYCPRIQCQKPVVVDKDDDMGYCQACDFPFCTKCKSTYHGTDLCKWEKDLLAVESKKKEADKKWNYKRMPVEERIKLLKEYSLGDKKAKKRMAKHFGKDELRDMMHFTQSQSWLHSHTKRCPKCKCLIQKIEGCNKMTCAKCRCYFCWVCNTMLDTRNPYVHFTDTNLKCYNQLMARVEVENHITVPYVKI